LLLLQGAQLRKHIDATLGSGNLREAVKLPPGEDLNEWLAVNSNYFSLSNTLLRAVYSTWSFLSPFIFEFPPLCIHRILKCSNLTFFYAYITAVDFFNQVNLLYGTLTEFCTPENCRTMSAGPKYGTFNWLISFFTFPFEGESVCMLLEILSDDVLSIIFAVGWENLSAPWNMWVGYLVSWVNW